MPHPAAVLTTERTLLAPFTLADADELLHVFRDPHVRRWLLDDVLVPEAWMHDEIRASDRRFARSGTGLWSVRLTADGTIAGFVGFREPNGAAEPSLLYGLLPAHWGKGLALEITTRVCNHVFGELGHARIGAATDLPNTASSTLLRRLGMRHVATTGDGVAGTALFAIDRDEWLAAHPCTPAT
ncbi:MAG TPA: GNAT family N-acetyltransferase [Planctomycetota bacterium]|nr:GNAT family N-acetyltransferase [Planctomycetota bacterium]